jgi:hypothetical protein
VWLNSRTATDRVAEQEVLQVLNEIESLKVALEESQEERRRKIAYDEIASRINELPSRAEQER